MTWGAMAGAASFVSQGAAAAAFLPTDIAGLKVWLDASDIATLFQDSAKTTPVTADTDPVGAWADKSGNTNDVKQAVAGSRPAYRTNIRNGLPALLFDGTADFLKSVAFGAALTQPNTIFVVVYIPSTGGAVFLAIVDGIVSTNRHLMTRRNSSNQLRIDAGASLDSTETLDKWVVWSALFNGASSQYWLDGVSEASGNAGTVTLTGLTVGARYDGAATWFSSYIAEILVYNANLSTSDRQAVEAYLLVKWGFL